MPFAADPDADGLTNLQEFQQGLNPNMKDGNLPPPVYNSVDCGVPYQTMPMTCTVNGSNLPSDLALTAANCTDIQLLPSSASPTQRQFTCTPVNQGTLQIYLSSAAVGPGGSYARNLTVKPSPCAAGQVLNLQRQCVTPPPVANYNRLNDTGITAAQCYQAGSDVLVSCTSAGAIALNNAQDGMIGRDVTVNNNADGKGGFSFSPVAGGCVKDNVTGLMWEVKTTDGGLRDWTKTYTHYDNPLIIQKWGGTAPTQAEIDAPTNSIGFVNAVNAQGLCGFNDWRLPSADELQSIVDYGVAYPGPVIDPTWFPNTQQSAFWSASSSVGVTNYAWFVYFDYGNVYSYSRNSSFYVRLVRASQ